MLSEISIHAPREGGDDSHSSPTSLGSISIHAPREGGDHLQQGGQHPRRHFNPRPPRGGRHTGERPALQADPHFNPRPPRGGRPQLLRVHVDVLRIISIHAPREGGDFVSLQQVVYCAEKFQSTPPARGATCQNIRSRPVESGYFNPRPPRGGRPPLLSMRTTTAWYFNPRPPRGGRRQIVGAPAEIASISIHAPREGGDVSRVSACRCPPYFNPRPPRGGRQLFGVCGQRHVNFNPRPPRGGRPPMIRASRSINRYFNPRPPRGGRPTRIYQYHAPAAFQSTPPARGATIEFSPCAGKR